MPIRDDWYIAIDPARTEIKEVPSDLRGLDRIEYNSYSDLGTKLTLLMEQWYPLRKPASIDDFINDRKGQVIELLRRSGGLTMGNIATVVGLEVAVLRLVVRPMVGLEIETRGARKATRYYLRGSCPTPPATVNILADEFRSPLR